MEGVFDYAQIAIRTIILANGAGATAILAFLGNAVAKDAKPINTLALGIATGMFALGVAAGVVATFLAYLSQYKVIRMSLEADGIVPVGATWERIVAIVAVFVGLGLFLLGVGFATRGYLGG